MGEAVERHEKAKRHLSIPQETVDFVQHLEKLEDDHARLNS